MQARRLKQWTLTACCRVKRRVCEQGDLAKDAPHARQQGRFVAQTWQLHGAQ